MFEAIFDNASKLLTLADSRHRVAAATYGNAVVGNRTAHSLMPEFEQTLGPTPRPIAEYAKLLSDFFMGLWPQDRDDLDPMYFVVGGIGENNLYGQIYTIRIPDAPDPEEQMPDTFGMSWGGQLEIVNRLIHGFDPALLADIKQGNPDIDMEQLDGELQSRYAITIPYESLPLQDCIDVAAFLIRTTITAQSLSVGPRGVGGTIEIVTITRTGGVQWVQQRQLRGERT